MSDAHQKLPTEDRPLTEDERWARAADWSDYRKAYGVSADPKELRHEYALFCAGWNAGRRSRWDQQDRRTT